MYCYRKPVLALLSMITYTNGRGQFTQAYVKKYVAWLHVLIALWTTQGSHVHTLFLRWYALVVFETEWKNNCDHSHFSQFKIVSHSASTVLIQQEPFSALYFDGQVPSLQIRITVLFSTDLQTPSTALPGFPATLSVFWNVSTHFFYPCTHSVVASFTLCRERYLAGTFSVTTQWFSKFIWPKHEHIVLLILERVWWYNQSTYVCLCLACSVQHFVAASDDTRLSQYQCSLSGEY